MSTSTCPNCSEPLSAKDMPISILFCFTCPKCSAQLKFNTIERIGRVLPKCLYLSIIWAFMITIVPGASYWLMISSYLNIFTFGGLCFYNTFQLEELHRMPDYNALDIVSNKQATQ